MKRYDFLLADADNTLLDFDLAERTAVSALFNEFGVPVDETLLKEYSEHNDRLWKMLERGELTIDGLIARRFTEFFALHGFTGDGMTAAVRYRQILSACPFKTAGADELLLRCKGKIKVYIISNGVSSVQYARLGLAGITAMADGIFLSEDIGAKKPDAAFFEKAASLIDGFSKERTLVYGDSLSADIAGGAEFGVDTCWFNPDGKENRTAYTPDYEIREHSGLYPILNI